MSALCVHCNHIKEAHGPYAEDVFCCPIENEMGEWIGWHPVNRFKPRADVMSIDLKRHKDSSAIPHHVGSEKQFTEGRGSGDKLEPPPQPAEGAGEKWLREVAHVLDMADDYFKSEQDRLGHVVTFYGNHSISALGYIRHAISLIAKQPQCPRCAELEAVVGKLNERISRYCVTDVPALQAKVAELERERDEARAEIQSVLNYMEKDYVKCFEGGLEEVIYASLALSVARVRAERDDLKATLDKIAGIKGTPVVLALLKERDDLQAKLAAVERHMASCRATAGVPDDETLSVHLAELKAKCEALEKALREIVACGGNLPDDRLTDRSGPNDAAQRGLMYCAARAIANAALAGKEDAR